VQETAAILLPGLSDDSTDFIFASGLDIPPTLATTAISGILAQLCYANRKANPN
jgi:hypothetical protein